MIELKVVQLSYTCSVYQEIGPDRQSPEDFRLIEKVSYSIPMHINSFSTYYSMLCLAWHLQCIHWSRPHLPSAGPETWSVLVMEHCRPAPTRPATHAVSGVAAGNLARNHHVKKKL